jgi:predicted RNase H-like HicB family nuclease
LKQPYTRLVIPDESGGYFAEVLELPGCFAEGDQAVDALTSLERAMESWLLAAEEQGLSIPEPTGNHEASGRLLLRLPKSLHRRAGLLAERDGVSLNQFVVSAIAENVGGHTAVSRLENRFSSVLRLALHGQANESSAMRREEWNPTMIANSSQQELN